ncbi:MAG TPA: PIG-L family deacetylase [Anaerolineales bacterium]
MRWIYLSPHFDDAVLSCGGLIWEQSQQGIPVEIWTVNAGDPPPGPDSDLITRVHTMWQTGNPGQTVAHRRLEDRAAASLAGAGLRHLNNVDAIYRRTRTGELMYAVDVFDPIHPAEKGIVRSTARKIAQGLRAGDSLVCPLALGSHVDHIITRKASESLGHPLWYYADIPYLFNHPDELAQAVTALKAIDFPISARGLAAWQASISAHRSQISSLFLDLDDMRAKIEAHSSSQNGLTLWKQV